MSQPRCKCSDTPQISTPHHTINRLNAAVFAQGILNVIGTTTGEIQLFQQMKISPTVAFVYCGGAKEGEFLGVLHSPADGSLQLLYSNVMTVSLIQADLEQCLAASMELIAVLIEA